MNEGTLKDKIVVYTLPGIEPRIRDCPFVEIQFYFRRYYVQATEELCRFLPLENCRRQ